MQAPGALQQRITIGDLDVRPLADLQSSHLIGDPEGPKTIDMWLNVAAFELAPSGIFGNQPRNALRGPKSSVTDLALLKNVPIGGDVKLQIRAEIFNVFNTVNYGNPNASFGAAAFGRITTAGPMRQIQIGGKLIF